MGSSVEFFKEIESDSFKPSSEIVDFRSGDTVKVSIKIKEGEKFRVQTFEGIVISRRGSGISANFTVRKVSNGVGVERIFPVHCPNVTDVEIVSKGKVRRSKLYYLRNRVGKKSKVKVDVSKNVKLNLG